MKKVIMLMLLTALSTSINAQETQLVNESASNTINKSIDVGSDYKGKTTLSIEPVWLTLNEIFMNLQFQVSNKITIGPVLAYMKDAEGIYASGFRNKYVLGGEKTERVKYGVRSNLHFSGVNRSSSYLGLIITRADNKVIDTATMEGGNNIGKGRFHEYEAGLSYGYEWKWSKISLSLGGGLVSYFGGPDAVKMTNTNGSVSQRYVDNSNYGILIDFGLGYRF